VVVDPKLLEQDLMLVRRNGALESLFCFPLAHATLLHKSPKGRVVQVVDVTF
jgi:hypothetical protein